jgi:probable HAF family extracellular repeat protein
MRIHFATLLTPVVLGLLWAGAAPVRADCHGDPHGPGYVMHDLGALPNGGWAPELVAGHYVVPIYQDPNYPFPPADRYVILEVDAARLAALGTLGGASTVALARNARGDLVGRSDVPPVITPEFAAYPHHAFKSSHGGHGSQLLDLGTFTQDARLGSTAFDISENGVVVGSAAVDLVVTPESEAAPQHAFLHDGHHLRDLGTLTTDARLSSVAYGVNGGGKVVGSAAVDEIDTPEYQAFPQHAFLWQNGVMEDLGTLSTNPVVSSYAYGINEAGHVVGTAGAAIVEGEGWSMVVQHAFTYTASGGMRDLGTLGGFQSAGYAIDGAGRVAGKSNLPAASGLPWDEEEHAVVWDDGHLIDLGALAEGRPSAAYAFDAQGRIYGLARDADWSFHLVRWERGGHD